jgi:cytochrome c556
MRKVVGIGLLLIGGLLLCRMTVTASEHAQHAVALPAGPIRDRHELMESIGKHAKKIGQAVKANDAKAVVPEAEAIRAEAQKIPALFPPGSTHERSRAKPEIWTDWKKFEASTTGLEQDASALAQAGRDGGDIGAASKKMFANCKSCHDAFRVPKEGE